MTGVRLGDRLLHIGCADPSLLGAVSSKVGVTGRSCALAPDDAAAARARRGAEKAGALVGIVRSTIDRCPFLDGAFNLVVVDGTDGLMASLSQAHRRECVGEGRRVLDTRGRLVVIESGRPTGLAGIFKKNPVDPAYQAAGGTPALLEEAGFRIVRTLAERDGLVFIEGAK
jgi:ubiquinone/menaquinone biosynthesis C-methylase UbiE